MDSRSIFLIYSAVLTCLQVIFQWLELLHSARAQRMVAHEVCTSFRHLLSPLSSSPLLSSVHPCSPPLCRRIWHNWPKSLKNTFKCCNCNLLVSVPSILRSGHSNSFVSVTKANWREIISKSNIFAVFSFIPICKPCNHLLSEYAGSLDLPLGSGKNI